jgi:hypothetical protein
MFSRVHEEGKFDTCCHSTIKKIATYHLKVVAYRCVFLQGASHFAVAFCALLNQSNLSSVMPLLDSLKGYSFPLFYSILNTLK